MTFLSTTYEILTRELHEALLRNDGVENTSVLHNVRIRGKSNASHQIDVYWEFLLAGVKYKTCIECKHLNHSVKKSDIAAFATVLDDIGNTTGIFATTIGFQKGAVQLARERGIRLILVNPLLKSVDIIYMISRSDTYITDVQYDLEQAKEKLKEQGLSQFSHKVYWQKETVFYDETGKPLTTLDNLLKQSTLSQEGAIEPDDLYDLTPAGLFRIKRICYKKVDSCREIKDEIKVNHVCKAIMEDVLDNRSLYLNDDLSVTEIAT
jgi:hypothetical protein